MRHGDLPSTLGGWSQPAPGYFQTLCSRVGLSHGSPPSPPAQVPYEAFDGVGAACSRGSSEVTDLVDKCKLSQDVLKVQIYFKYVKSKVGTKPLKYAFVSYERKLFVSLPRVEKNAFATSAAAYRGLSGCSFGCSRKYSTSATVAAAGAAIRLSLQSVAILQDPSS